MLQNRDQHLFSVDDYEQMTAHGILTENDRVELIRGEILTKMAIGSQHSACVKRCNQLFTTACAGRVIVGVQDPIQLADSKPEPDISLLRSRDDYYAAGDPLPADVFLLIEVADSTLDFDREIKGPLYAENGIAEYWIIDLAGECVEVYRQPSPDGKYGDVQTLRRGDETEIAALSDIIVNVSELLPPQTVKEFTNE